MEGDNKLIMMKIGLLLSENYGLKNWEMLGSLSRELKLYEKFSEDGINVIIFSYHKADEGRILKNGIIVKVLPFSNLPTSLVIIRQILFPFCKFRTLRHVNLLITNQAHNGGWVAVLSKLITDVPIVARCGYVFGEQMSVQKFIGLKNILRKWLERRTHKKAEISIVPTLELKKWLNVNYRIPVSQIHIIPNFVDATLFKPEEVSKEFDLIYVGRLHEEKRPFIILEAANILSLSVLFIGMGSLKDSLLNFSTKNGSKLTILDSVENNQLPKFLNKSKYFVTGSRWEGHPKAIIEAMSCGCVCICPDVSGINNLIRDRETGLLYNGMSEDLIRVLVSIEKDENLYKRISLDAREFCLNNFDFNSIYINYTNLISRFNINET